MKSGTVYKIGLDRIIPTKNEYALTFEGMIQIKTDGNYEFYFQSSDGICLYNNDQPVIKQNDTHGAGIVEMGRITLLKSNHPIRLQ